MTSGTVHAGEPWAVAPADVGGEDAQALLREYFAEVADRTAGCSSVAG